MMQISWDPDVGYLIRGRRSGFSSALAPSRTSPDTSPNRLIWVEADPVPWAKPIEWRIVPVTPSLSIAYPLSAALSASCQRQQQLLSYGWIEMGPKGVSYLWHSAGIFATPKNAITLVGTSCVAAPQSCC